VAVAIEQLDLPQKEGETTPETRLLAAELFFANKVVGKGYAIASWKLRGMAYSYGARTLFTMARAVGGDIASINWQVTTKKINVRSTTVYVPILKAIARHEPEVKQGLLALLYA